MWYPNKLTKLIANIAAIKNRNRIWNLPTPPSSWPFELTEEKYELKIEMELFDWILSNVAALWILTSQNNMQYLRTVAATKIQYRRPYPRNSTKYL